MKRILLSAFIATLSLGFTATHVEAKRLGGGTSQGMKRQLPSKPTPDASPSQQQAAKQATPPATPPAAAPAPAPKRSWLGPIAGLAAGLGIAALMSHLGFGADFANIVMMVLLLFVGVMLVRFLMRRFMKPSPGLQLAGAGANLNDVQRAEPTMRSAPILAQGGGAGGLPAGVDTSALERAAKMIFIRMQAANDSGDLNDLRQFSTPEMFAAFRLDLQDRKDAPQRTDVSALDAHILDVADQNGQQIVSGRFNGQVREETNGPTAAFDEVWHLVRPKDGSRDWAIAGIEQNH
jgi:predicted lipid-binding transport protein (Tim44 family)